MKSWALFLISIGSLIVCLANLTENPASLIVTGICCMVIGFISVRKGKKHDC